MVVSKGTDLRALDDEELLKYVDSNLNKDVFAILYDRYHKKVYFKCISMLKHEQNARDLTHDIFIKIFLKIKQFKGNSRLSLWIHSVAVHSCLTYIQKAKKRHNIFKEEEQDMLENLEDEGEVSIQEKMFLEMQLEELQDKLDRLKDEERIIILMKYIDGMSIKEIALILNLGQSAVKMKLKRTREKIYKMFVNDKNMKNHE